MNNGKKISVIAVIPGKEYGSSMLFVKKQIQSLKNEGINIQEFYLSSRTTPISIIREFFRFRKIIKKIKPNIIHAHYGTMTSFFCASGAMIPLVITFHGSDLNNIAQVVGFLRDITRRFLSNISTLRASNIICVSERIADNLWWNKKMVEIIPSGVNVKLFHPEPKSEARKKLNWPMDEKVVLFNHGSNSQLKRLDIAEAAIEETKKYLPEIRIEILRDIDHSMVPVYINASDCLLLCSESEGSPTIVKEALACNLPVVSVDVGDVSERLKGVQPSKIVDRDICKLAKALVEILKINSRSNGKQMIDLYLSEDIIAHKIIAVYNNIINDS